MIRVSTMRKLLEGVDDSEMIELSAEQDGIYEWSSW